MTTDERSTGAGGSATATARPLLEARAIGKRFGGVAALREVTVAFAAGKVHALVGENGAGKSTLAKILTGGVRPDEGELLLDGEPVVFGSPHAALERGLAMLLQEISLVPDRTVLENVYLGQEPTRWGTVRRRRLREQFAELSGRFGLELDATAKVGSLRLVDQQKVELLRAISRDARLIVMDEPTAVMTADEVQNLARIIATLKAEGVAILYVSHSLKEVLELSEMVTVLRDGQLVSTLPAAEHDEDSLMEAMLGRNLNRVFPGLPKSSSEPALRVSGLSRDGVLSDISLEVGKGEIVGLAGLVGSGRTELARAIAGVDPIDAGSIAVAGREVRIRSPRHGIRQGIGLIPESRKEQGLCPGLSIAANTTLTHLDRVTPHGVLLRRRELDEVRSAMLRFDIRASGSSMPVSRLSGGNQQKVLFAKTLMRPPAVLIADEPTRGVDVGAKVGIYRILVDLAKEGMGVLLISSEIEEILGLSHRVLVMRGGRLVAEFDREAASEQAVMREAFGARSELEGGEVDGV